MVSPLWSTWLSYWYYNTRHVNVQVVAYYGNSSVAPHMPIRSHYNPFLRESIVGGAAAPGLTSRVYQKTRIQHVVKAYMHGGLLKIALVLWFSRYESSSQLENDRLIHLSNIIQPHWQVLDITATINTTGKFKYIRLGGHNTRNWIAVEFTSRSIGVWAVWAFLTFRNRSSFLRNISSRMMDFHEFSSWLLVWREGYTKVGNTNLLSEQLDILLPPNVHVGCWMRAFIYHRDYPEAGPPTYVFVHHWTWLISSFNYIVSYYYYGACVPVVKD